MKITVIGSGNMGGACNRKQMEAGNMLAGCGIAYVMMMVRTMMEGGVELGLYPDVAKELDHAGFNSAVIRCLKAGMK